MHFNKKESHLKIQRLNFDVVMGLNFELVGMEWNPGQSEDYA